MSDITYLDHTLIKKIIKNWQFPETFVETGTYRGNSVRGALRFFSTIHTIELSRQWYESALEQFKNEKKVICHHGDSAEVLKKLSAEIHEPVFFFLDAHYSGGSTARGKEECPLLRELEIIKERKTADIILIDDADTFGKKATFGVAGSSVYPQFEGDWHNINIPAIKKVLGDRGDNFICKINYFQLLIVTKQKRIDVMIFSLRFFIERVKRYLKRITGLVLSRLKAPVKKPSV
ncbi:MAG TPA: hypothetical protein PLO85_06370 [Candidatus Omnitrophota bacterium]|nr:hypothetical protein [Candidatus Omnitrophota bacterium]